MLIVRKAIKLRKIFRGLNEIGTRWVIFTSFYAAIGIAIPPVNHGFFSEYLAPYLYHIHPICYATGIITGFIGFGSSLLAVLLTLAAIGRRLPRTREMDHWFALTVAVIVLIIGLTEAYFLPRMFDITNMSYFWFLSSVVGLGTFFHLQEVNSMKEGISNFSLEELKLWHSETLELFRTMAWGGVIFLTGVILSGILNFPGHFEEGSALQGMAWTTVLLTMLDVAYGIVGYVFLCLGSLIERLQQIRLLVRQVEQ